MINPIVKEQLNNCKVANIPDYNDDTFSLRIKGKKTQNNQTCIPGHYYDIELANYIIKPTPDFNLHINWNKNIVPKSKYYRCEVVQILSNMIKINGVGYDVDNQTTIDDSWSGWLPLDGIEILREI